MANRTKKIGRYEFIRAVVCEGELVWTYQITGKPAGSLRHDEDVSEWTDRDIINLTRSMLSVGDDEPDSIIDVRWE